MKIIVQIKTNSSQSKVEKIDEGRYKVWVRSVPEKGMANKEMLELISSHFKIAKSATRLVTGKTSRQKIVDIDC